MLKYLKYALPIMLLPISLQSFAMDKDESKPITQVNGFFVSQDKTGKLEVYSVLENCILDHGIRKKSCYLTILNSKVKSYYSTEDDLSSIQDLNIDEVSSNLTELSTEEYSQYKKYVSFTNTQDFYSEDVYAGVVEPPRYPDIEPGSPTERALDREYYRERNDRVQRHSDQDRAEKEAVQLANSIQSCISTVQDVSKYFVTASDFISKLMPLAAGIGAINPALGVIITEQAGIAWAVATITQTGTGSAVICNITTPIAIGIKEKVKDIINRNTNPGVANLGNSITRGRGRYGHD